MARIIVTKDGKLLREFVLDKARITIGRGPHNDIVLDDLAISAEHAAILRHERDWSLEDLNSTNGTQVNGQPVRTHFLQDGDMVELAQYRIRFDGPHRCETVSAPNSANKIKGKAPRIRIITGLHAGKEILLNKPIISLGTPGVQVAAITRRDDGYYLIHVEGDAFPLLNGEPLGVQAQRINDGDVIITAGAEIRFLESETPLR